MNDVVWRCQLLPIFYNNPPVPVPVASRVYMYRCVFIFYRIVYTHTHNTHTPTHTHTTPPTHTHTLPPHTHTLSLFQCQPNLVVYSVWIECLDKRLPRIAFFSRQKISSGEELTFDYHMNHNQYISVSPATHKKMCLCGADKCLGYYY